ncbi:hypothetical protein [Paludisphaera mucosa]|uniref:Uncharacterized protein n=1 Tax=Paludisphaera mucosa TaxID=3030827 RepID=A0ABT6FFA2_9BACT|nr:hypothetical protein [Paludisphaera mucosa]MDG3006176.1 hypothetical protein [Paludisphaera mucosa]
MSLVGAFSLLAPSEFLAVGYLLGGWPIVAAYLLFYGTAAVLIIRCNVRAGWGRRHRLALAGGTLPTYAWHSFVE